MSFEEMIAEFIEQTGGSVIIRGGPNGGAVVTLLTPSSASVSRVPISTASEEILLPLIRETFLTLKLRHSTKCAASSCVSASALGKRS